MLLWLLLAVDATVAVGIGDRIVVGGTAAGLDGAGTAIAAAVP